LIVDRSHARSSCRLLGLVLLAALAATAAGAAARPPVLQPRLPLAATAPASAAAAVPAASQSPKPPESEQEEIYNYLHAPAVRWIARKLHLSANAASRIFVFINFAILFFLIAAPLAKIMPKVMRKRTETLRHNIRTAREVGEDAKARLSAMEAKLAGLGAEIEEIRAQVEREIQEDQARIKTALEEEKTRIVAAAEQELNVATLQARRGLRALAAGMAIEQASKQFVLTPETDRALIAEFIGHVDGDHDGAAHGGEQ
jgi:F-type H+-transporting ATPase subunit b